MTRDTVRDPHLAEVMAVWPELSALERRVILALVRQRGENGCGRGEEERKGTD